MNSDVIQLLPNSYTLVRDSEELQLGYSGDVINIESLSEQYKCEDAVQGSKYANEEVLASLRFWNIKYASTFSEFLRDLHSEAENCNFLEKERMLRDKIVMSTSGELQKRLINENDLNLDKTVDICQLYEATTSSLQSKNEPSRGQKSSVLKNVKSKQAQNLYSKGVSHVLLNKLKEKTNEAHAAAFDAIQYSKVNISSMNDEDLDFANDMKHEGGSSSIGKEVVSLYSISDIDTTFMNVENVPKYVKQSIKEQRAKKLEPSMKGNKGETCNKKRSSIPKTVDEKTKLFLKRKLLKPMDLIDIKPEEPDLLEEENLYIECQQCLKQFKSKAKYNAHYGEHIGLELHCTICSRKYYNVRWLNRHLADKHDIIVSTNYSNPDHMCDECGKTYSSKADLKKHKIALHSGVKPFQCKICSKCFSHASNLKTHLDWHNNIKRFVCSYCGKAFGNRAKMEDHQVTHTGERPFKCDSCEKTFKFYGNLRTHWLVNHALVRPYVCEKCGKGYVETRYFRKHKLRCYKDTN